MNIFLKAIIGVLIAVVLYQTISKQDKSIAIALSVAVCCMVAVAAMSFWEHISVFLLKLEQLGNIDHSYIKIILKAVGICLLADITASVCADAGNSSLGKVLQLLSSAVIIYLALPLFTELISLAEKILGDI